MLISKGLVNFMWGHNLVFIVSLIEKKKVFKK